MRLIQFLSAAAIVMIAQTASSQVGQEINVELKLQQDSAIYLANYYGPKLFYKDTAVRAENGSYSFDNPKGLPAGVYAIVLGDKKTYFEVIVNEPKFSVVVSDKKFMETLKFQGSPENTEFYDYQRTLTAKRKLADPFSKVMGNEEAKEKEKDAAREELSKIEDEVKAFQANFVKKNDGLLIAKIMQAGMDPEVPAELEADKEKRYYWYKSHYFDNIDMQDDRMVRTPIFGNKIEFFMTKVVPQTPDSINAAADFAIALTGDNQDMFRYVTHWITNRFETSKIMGMDAVFVHMAEKYYMTGKAFWMDSAKIAKVEERAKALKPVLIGKYAPNIVLQDTSEKEWVSLYDVKSSLTVLAFWDPNCGHCKKAMPLVVDFHKEYKDKGIEVFAVGGELETKDWKKFIRDKKMGDFINVSDNPEIHDNPEKYIYSGQTDIKSLNFRQTYDLFSYPKFFVLDENKKIIGKSIGAEQLPDFIDQVLEQKNKSKEEEAKKDKS